ncbi:hypothetical protein BDZ94DRAFT_1166160 [Collybia nuda]|uniref:Uncharacterized protein n=1 Tax=Collybia nuda TaxID=64659 RepID=A0A9P5Y4V6_9AGAR|nr:hypothetical protein BDZ94DRAFT_1166160 [Collybia nuda]
MPSLTTTIEDTSPLISYSPEWTAGSSADNEASRYSQSSFTLTSTSGAVASFAFNGTGVQIFGAKRGNHGSFQVKVDDTLFPSISGNAADPGLYQQQLFSTTTLNQGLHVVTLTNQEKAFVDIDFITWQTNMGTEADKIFVNTFQDTDPSFTYLPDGPDWSTNPDKIGSFMGGSGHTTSTPGASFTYTFKVCSPNRVSLFGPVSPDGSMYSVQVDGGRVQKFAANKTSYVPQTLLYHADSLGSGEHHLKLSVQPVSAGQVFAIDYATVLTTSAPLTSGPQ